MLLVHLPNGSAACCLQESDKIRLRREAKKAKGFYVEDETKVVFAIRIRGINDMHPKAGARSASCRTAAPQTACQMSPVAHNAADFSSVVWPLQSAFA